jgi:hypothetical protein
MIQLLPVIQILHFLTPAFVIMHQYKNCLISPCELLMTLAFAIMTIPFLTKIVSNIWKERNTYWLRTRSLVGCSLTANLSVFYKCT